MRCSIFALVVSTLLLTACDGDGAKQGGRTPCALAPGELIGCSEPDIASADDACFRLVDCGAIPLDAEENFIFDWANCVRFLETRDDAEQDYLLACVEIASCDELKDDASPERPSPPTCFAFDIDPRPDQP